ncbi:MAG: hypothetical protein ABI192_08165 [Bradyrhizobium sp.]
MSELATSNFSNGDLRRGAMARWWALGHAAVRGFAAHPDPLAEASNWVALTIGSHLPFWPLYIFWVAGREALPSSLLTAAMAPLFLAVPILTRRSSLLGRLATPLLGLANTIFVVWILGPDSGTEVFLVPCAALSALIFRRPERLLMLVLTALPLMVWCLLRRYPPTPLHHYNAAVMRDLVVLNVWSIAILIVLFGWFQVDIYRKMEAPRSGS